MKRSYGGLIAAIGGTTLLALAGCSSMDNMTDTTSATNPTGKPGYYTVKGRYYHCHDDGRCHNVRHSSYLWRGGLYRDGTPSHYHRYPQPPR